MTRGERRRSARACDKNQLVAKEIESSLGLDDAVPRESHPIDISRNEDIRGRSVFNLLSHCVASPVGCDNLASGNEPIPLVGIINRVLETCSAKHSEISRSSYVAGCTQRPERRYHEQRRQERWHEKRQLRRARCLCRGSLQRDEPVAILGVLAGGIEAARFSPISSFEFRVLIARPPCQIFI
jgi:hypothetical protein